MFTDFFLIVLLTIGLVAAVPASFLIMAGLAKRKWKMAGLGLLISILPIVCIGLFYRHYCINLPGNGNSSDKYIPERSVEMSEGIYTKYKTKLDTAYLKNDHFEVAIQMANLNAPPEIIFNNLEMGVKENIQNYYKVHEWYQLFKENNFQVNLVKVDTLKYTEVYKICVDQLGKQSLVEFENEKIRKHELEIQKREKLDSSRFDPDLMSQLEQIERDDQELRKAMNARNITKQELDNLWIEQNKIDSVNLGKVDLILTRYGYPKKEKVGYDLASTVWLVLHHQSDLKTRDKYQKWIDQNASEGQIKAYHWRSEDLRLETVKK